MASKKKELFTSTKQLKATVAELEARAERAERKAARWKKRARKAEAEASGLEARATKLDKKLTKVRDAAQAPTAADPAQPPAPGASQEDQHAEMDSGESSATPDAGWTVAQLRAEARSRGLTGLSNKPKAELLDALR